MRRLLLSLILVLSLLNIPIAKAVNIGSYLVIAATGLEDSVGKLVLHRQSQGYTVKVVTTTEIIKSSSGIPATTQIWNYIKDSWKKLDLNFVLFVGDAISIPMPMLYAAKDVDQPSLDKPGPVYSDRYYEILNTIWDRDNDGRLGEPGDDNVIIKPDIAVGRIPFSNPGLVQQVCGRIIAYDSSNSRKTALQASAIYLFQNENGDPTNLYTDGSNMQDKIWEDILKPADFIRKTMDECDGTKPGKRGDMCLNGANLLAELTRNEYGMVNWLAHGEATKIDRKYWLLDTNGDGHADSEEIRRISLLTVESLYATNIKARLIISTACSTANFIGGVDSLGTASLRAGAGAFIGGMSMNYYTPGWVNPIDGGNQTISYNITKNYVGGDSIGWAMAKTMENFANDFRAQPVWADKYLQNVYSYILLGDPGMRLEPFQTQAELKMTLNPPNVSIQNCKNGQSTLSFGKVSAILPLKLRFSAPSGITLSFDPKEPLPNQDVKIDIDVECSIPQGSYFINIGAESIHYKGQTQLVIQVIGPPPSVTKLKLFPEYTYVAPKQEFWLDLLIFPSVPVDSISVLLDFDSSLFDFLNWRMGEFPTQDYRCTEIIKKPKDTGQINFSFARNNLKFGSDSPGIVFSFCFKGKKIGISNISIKFQQCLGTGRKALDLSDLPYCRVNVYEKNDAKGFTLSSNLVDGQTSNDENLLVKGRITAGQELVIVGSSMIIPQLSSDGDFQVQFPLQRRNNDLLFKIKDTTTGRELWVRRLVINSNFMELAFHQDEKTAWRNNRCEELDAAPFIKSGRLLVPLRFIAENLGFKVDYAPAERKITLTRSDKTISMWVDKLEAYIDGQLIKLDVPPTVKSGRTFVPLRFVSESTGADVRWDSESKTARVFAKKSK